MRKISLIVVAFLLVLYITPMIFISSSVGVAIPAEPNMNKDFSLSEYGDESPQSITHFEETLPDNVLHYPDTFYGPPVYATDGERWPNPTGCLSNTYVDNSDSFGATSYSTAFYSCNVTMTFEEMTYDEGLYYHFKVYSHAYNNASSFWILKYHCESHSSQWELLETLSSGALFTYTDTLFSDKYIIDGNVTFMLKATTAGAYAGCYVNYACVGTPIMTLADSDHYAESFYNVSDWTTSDTSISSDGDLATITENGAGSTGRAYASFSSTDYFEYYYEFSISTMTATTTNLEFWDGSAYNTLHTFTTVGTYKGIISDSDATTMQRIGFLVGSNGGNIKPDYLRISPSDEFGWQHDGSTTVGFAPKNEYCVLSTDGDLLNFSADGSIAFWDIVFDSTATLAYIDPDYYPMVKYSFTASSSGVREWTTRWYYRGGHYYGAYIDDTLGVSYENLLAGAGGSNDRYKMRLWCDADEWFTLDYIKLYSIANFTVTQSGATTDDYLYVDSGTLYSHIDDGYIETNLDPALSVTDTYSIYNLTTSGTTPEFSQYVSSWSSYSDDTRGATTSGTLTDIKLKFDSTEIISEIKFIDDRHWRSVEAVTIYFNIPLFTGSFDVLLIMLGLVMIPASTLYFVKGGRSEMSTDKLFYVLIVFVMGWGLFLGGIFG